MVKDWWTKDNAGHGGSTWKVYVETEKGLIRYKDVDKFGIYMNNKHQSDICELIP